MSFIQTIPYRARPAYFWYLRSQMLEGIFAGSVFQMIKYVGLKTIGISPFQVSVLSSFTALGMFTAFLIPTLFNLKTQKQAIVWTNVPCKILLASLAFFTDPFAFFCLAALGLMFLKMQEPFRISLLKTNLPTSSRFGIVSHVRRLELVCFMLAFLLAGYLLDINGMWYRIVFPVSCALGLTGLWMITKLRETVEVVPQKIISLRRFMSVMRNDRVYMQYQILFSISGLVNLMGLPLYAIYSVEVLNAEYTELAVARGLMLGVASIISMKWWGRMMDKYPNPIQMRALLSVIWCLHPICYIVASDMWMIYIAEAWFGFIFAGGQLNWMLGPLYFCGDKDAPLYTTIHSFMNGIRGIIAPLLGYVLYSWIGFIPTFAVIAFVMFANSIAIYMLYVKTKDLERFQTVEAVP